MSLDRLAARGRRTGAPGRPTRAIVWLLLALARPVVRVMYRPTLEGTENLPREGAFMLVANHGASLGAADILAIAVMWLERFGVERPLAGFAHPFAFHLWPISIFMSQLGAIPSTFADGESTLASGVPILIFPGGDHEATRPFWLGQKTDFGGRVGFLKLARKAKVPIVPMGVAGSHMTAPVLLRSKRALSVAYVLPRLLGVKRYPFTVLAALGAIAIVLALPQLPYARFAFAFAFLASPLTLIPWVPCKLRARVGTPLSPDELFAGVDDELTPALARVEAEIDALMKR
jgi:1-acyl-sn-glycerol-3-phosphate acyltransferase